MSGDAAGVESRFMVLPLMGRGGGGCAKPLFRVAGRRGAGQEWGPTGFNLGPVQVLLQYYH